MLNPISRVVFSEVISADDPRIRFGHRFLRLVSIGHLCFLALVLAAGEAGGQWLNVLVISLVQTVASALLGLGVSNPKRYQVLVVLLCAVNYSAVFAVMYLAGGYPSLLWMIALFGIFPSAFFLGRTGAVSIAGVTLAGLLAPHAGALDTATLVGAGSEVTMVVVLGLLASAVFRVVSEAEGQQRRAAAELESANRSLVELLQDQHAESEKKVVLNEMSELIQACGSSEEAFSILASYGRRLFSTEAGAFFIYRNSRDYLELTSHWGDLPPEHLRSFTAGECWALRRGRLYRAGGAGDILCHHLEETSRPRADTICVPMMAQGEILGVFHLAAESGTAIDETLAATVARDGALGLANLRLRDTLRNQALRDPVTQLYNRRYLEEALPREIHRAERRNQPLALAMLDVDRFKAFNDTYGHEAGDLVLHEVGAILRSFTRAEDLACRYGGEEFVVVFADTPLEDALHRLETLRGRISAASILHAGKPLGRITVSAGLAATPGTHGAALLKTADQLLYRAKAAGRDRIVSPAEAPSDAKEITSDIRKAPGIRVGPAGREIV